MITCVVFFKSYFHFYILLVEIKCTSYLSYHAYRYQRCYTDLMTMVFRINMHEQFNFIKLSISIATYTEITCLASSGYRNVRYEAISDRSRNNWNAALFPKKESS